MRLDRVSTTWRARRTHNNAFDVWVLVVALTIARGDVRGLWASGPAAVAFVAPAVLALARRPIPPPR